MLFRSQTIGVPHPLPSIRAFQRKFSVSLQVTGGSASDATPFQFGPRHCGQYFRDSSAMSCVETNPTNSTAAIVVSRRCFIFFRLSILHWPFLRFNGHGCTPTRFSCHHCSVGLNLTRMHQAITDLVCLKCSTHYLPVALPIPTR